MIIPPLPGQPRQRLAQHRRGFDGNIALRANAPGGTPITRPWPTLTATTIRPNSTRPWPIIASGCRRTNSTPALKKGGQEFFFNQIEPFYKSMVIYVAAHAVGLRLLDQFVGAGAADGIRPAGAGLCHSFAGPGIPHVSGRPSAGDQFVFLGHFHRLGRVLVRHHFGANLQRRHRIGGGGVHRVHHVDHRPSPGLERRHHGNAASGAGHQFVAGHARRGRDFGLCVDVCGRHCWR